jgi:hypothetical protein
MSEDSLSPKRTAKSPKKKVYKDGRFSKTRFQKRHDLRHQYSEVFYHREDN